MYPTQFPMIIVSRRRDSGLESYRATSIFEARSLGAANSRAASRGGNPWTEKGGREPPAATRFCPSPDSSRRHPLNRSTPFIPEQPTTSPPTADASQYGVVGCRKAQDVRRSWLGCFDLPGNCSDQGNPAEHPLATNECSIWRSLWITSRPKSCAAIVDGCTALWPARTEGKESFKLKCADVTVAARSVVSISVQHPWDHKGASIANRRS